MAVKKTAAPATTTPAAAPGFASLDPEQMGVGGLPSGFRARVECARYVPMNFKSKDGVGFTRRDGTVSNPNEHRIALMLILEPLPGELDQPLEPIIYSAGDLGKLVPSNDGETPAGGSFDDYAALARGAVDETITKPWTDQDLWGIGALRVSNVGTKGPRRWADEKTDGPAPKITRSSNAGILMEHMINAGLPQERVGGTADLLDGIEATWIRVPMPDRGNSQGDAKKQPRDILVPTDITAPPLGAGAGTGAPRATAAVGTKAASTSAAPAASASTAPADDAFANEVRGVIYAAVQAAGGTLSKGKVMPEIAKAYSSDRKALGPASALASSVEFLRDEQSSALWTFDAATGTLTANA